MTDVRRWPTDAQVAALHLGGARVDLMEEIMTTTTDNRVTPRRAPKRLPTWGQLIAVAAAIAVIVATPIWLAGRGGVGQHGGPASGAAQTAGSARPYAVLTAAGWTVDHVEGDPADGEIRYVRGERQLQINWRAGATFGSYVTSRSNIGRSTPVLLVGERSRMWTYSRTDRTTIRPVEGATFLEVRGEGMRKSGYLRLLGQVRGVDATGFGASLPGEVVDPDEVDVAVARMLQGVTVPKGFDPETISVPRFSDPYDAGAAVTSAVGCAWLHQYKTARGSGDSAAQHEAATAMAGSRSWAVLQDMNAEGDWPEVFWEIADDMVAGRPLVEAEQGIGCD